MKPGRTKQRIAKLLTTTLNTPINPHDIWTNHHAERNGTVRWGLTTQINGQTTKIHSWDTITECLQKGITITHHPHNNIEITPNDPK